MSLYILVSRIVADASVSVSSRITTQALGQCRKYLDTHYPNLERRTSESTASAALYAQQHPEAAAISSRLAGQLFGLDIADEGAEGKGIQDAGLTNETTFGVFVRAETR